MKSQGDEPADARAQTTAAPTQAEHRRWLVMWSPWGRQWSRSAQRRRSAAPMTGVVAIAFLTACRPSGESRLCVLMRQRPEEIVMTKVRPETVVTLAADQAEMPREVPASLAAHPVGRGIRRRHAV